MKLKQDDMDDSSDQQPEEKLKLLEQVDSLNLEVKSLALNLALYLAKAKSGEPKLSSSINRMEPEFIRLVNGTVRVVQELTMLLNASRNKERRLFEIPTQDDSQDYLEVRLRDILHQCACVLESLENEKNWHK